MPPSAICHRYVPLQINDPILRDYCKFLFPEKEDGYLKVSGRTAFGKLLIAHVRVADRMVPPPQQNGVLFSLPGSHTRALDDKWLYFDQNDTEVLNGALRSTFDTDFFVFYFNGLRLEYRKSDIVNAFISSRGLYSGDCFDALHKRAYRKEVEYQKRIYKKLSLRAARIDNIIQSDQPL